MKPKNQKNNRKQPKLFGLVSTFNKLNTQVIHDDEELEPLGESFCGYFMEHRSITRLVIPIDTSFKDPYHYRMVVNKIDELGEDDTVEFWMNSDGGDLSGLVALLTAIRTTKAQTLAVIKGSCHSAASILALSCDSIEISPYATMLCHSIRFGVTGKGADVRAQVQHTNDFADGIFREAYELFLTEQEMENVLKGLELWLSYDQIAERLEAKYKALAEDQEQDEPKVPFKPLPGCCGNPDGCDSICECPYAEDDLDEDEEPKLH